MPLATVRRIAKPAVVALSLVLCGSARAALIDWNVNPGGTYFNLNQFANWKPGGGANPNNKFGAATGTSGNVTWSIWDGYGPHGNATVGTSHNANDFHGQRYDVKAMYSRSDANNLYVGIVTGINLAGTRDPVFTNTFIYGGDLAIDPNFASATSRLGVITPKVKFGTSGFTSMVKGGIWNIPNQAVGFGPSPYSSYKSGGTVIANDVKYNYTYTGVNYYDDFSRQNMPIYLLEYTIPIADLQKPAGQSVALSYAQTCNNDSLQMSTAALGPLVAVPEPTSLGAGALLLIGLATRRRKR